MSEIVHVSAAASKGLRSEISCGHASVGDKKRKTSGDKCDKRCYVEIHYRLPIRFVERGFNAASVGLFSASPLRTVGAPFNAYGSPFKPGCRQDHVFMRAILASFSK